jgi:hypothetical protein
MSSRHFLSGHWPIVCLPKHYAQHVTRFVIIIPKYNYFNQFHALTFEFIDITLLLPKLTWTQSIIVIVSAFQLKPSKLSSFKIYFYVIFPFPLAFLCTFNLGIHPNVFLVYFLIA